MSTELAYDDDAQQAITRQVDFGDFGGGGGIDSGDAFDCHFARRQLLNHDVTMVEGSTTVSHRRWKMSNPNGNVINFVLI